MNWFHEKLGDTYIFLKRISLSIHPLAETIFPVCWPKIIALQVRQDMWWLLRILREFLPATEIRVSGLCMPIRIGGQLTCSVYVQSALKKLQNMLDDPVYGKRWKDCAIIKISVSRRSILL